MKISSLLSKALPWKDAPTILASKRGKEFLG